MPINVSPTEIIQRLKKYMKYIKKPRELIILVDMGSLEEMYSCLSDVKGLKAIIINNVSTRMAMDAGAKIRSSISLDKIAETVCCENRSTYRLVDNTIPQKAILFCSETGIGAAKRMSEMFAASFPKKLNIEFLSVDYKNVLEPKSLQIILDKYEVLFVVGTQDPQNPNISLNLGNVKLRENTHNLSKLVHVTDEEEKKLKALAAAGIEVEIRAVPNDDKIIIK